MGMSECKSSNPIDRLAAPMTYPICNNCRGRKTKYGVLVSIQGFPFLFRRFQNKSGFPQVRIATHLHGILPE
jgi:hypothetical protein